MPWVCVAALMSDDLKDRLYSRRIKAEYEKVRTQHKNKKGPSKILPIEDARANAFKPDWSNYQPPHSRNYLGIRTLNNYPLEKIVPFIDWTPFFQAWELAGRYPAILDDDVVGETASQPVP